MAVTIPQQQDGGYYGWLVVLASHVCNFFVFGVQQAIGPLFVALQSDFGSTSEQTSWLISLMFFCQLGFGPVANVSVKRFGYCATVMTGSLISSAGYLLTSFAPNIQVVNVTFGVLVGSGYALIFAPSMGIVALHIKKRYVLANSLAYLGSSVGGIVLGPIFQALINSYGWRDTLFLFAGVNLQMCICALFFRLPEASLGDAEVTANHSRDPVPVDRRGKSLMRVLTEQLDLTLFTKHKQYTVYVIAKSIGIGLGTYSTPGHWYARAEDLRLAPLQQLSVLVSIFAVGGVAGRLVPNIARCINSVYLFAFAIYLTGVLNIASAIAKTYTSYAVYIGIVGFTIGIICTMTCQTLRDIVGPENVTPGLGLSCLFEAVAALVSPIIAGHIYDETGDYDFSFYYYGTCSVIGGLLMVIADPFVKPARSQKRSWDLENTDGHSRL